MLNLTASIYSQLYSPFPSALCEQSLWQPSHVDIVTHSKDVTVSSPVYAGCCSLRSRPALPAKVPCRIKQTGGSPLVSQEGTTWIRWIISLGDIGEFGKFICFTFLPEKFSMRSIPFCPAAPQWTFKKTKQTSILWFINTSTEGLKHRIVL